MHVGYCRTSTIDQRAGFEAQKRDLTAAGCEKLFSEQVSSIGQREQLEAVLNFVREGDVLIVTKLDRLARSVRDLMRIVDELSDKKAALRILDLGMDTGSSTGKLMLTVLGAVAEFERQIMLERQREGVAKAKAAGKYKGRKPTVRARKAEIDELLSQGVRPVDVARQLGIARSSVYRVSSQT